MGAECSTRRACYKWRFCQYFRESGAGEGDLPRPHIPSLVSTFPARVSYPPPLVFLKASNSRAASSSLTQKLVFRAAATRLDSSKMVCHEILLCGGLCNGTVYRPEGPYFNCP